MAPPQPSFEPARNSPQQRGVKYALYFGFFLVLIWLYASQPAPTRAPEKQSPRTPLPTAGDATSPQNAKNNRDSRPTAPDGPSQTREDRDGSAIVQGARVTDEDGRVIYRGDVDLQPTLDRIERGKRLRFSHDGIVFENREHRLPQKPAGYYHEFVHPTPDDDGPGGQRVVLGRNGEVYYTPDHYRTFRRVQ